MAEILKEGTVYGIPTEEWKKLPPEKQKALSAAFVNIFGGVTAMAGVAQEALETNNVNYHPEDTPEEFK